MSISRLRGARAKATAKPNRDSANAAYVLPPTATRDALLEKGSDRRFRTLVNDLFTVASRMEIVVSQLVDAARLLSGTLELAPAPIDLLGAAQSVRQELGRWDPSELVVRGDTAVARVDPARFRSMVLAMVESARWFAEEGAVEIEVRPGPSPSLSVSRARPALGAEEAQRLFEPREPLTGGGSKVGLFVARGLARAHGGGLEVDVDAGERLRFTLTLPAADATPRP